MEKSALRFQSTKKRARFTQRSAEKMQKYRANSRLMKMQMKKCRRNVRSRKSQIEKSQPNVRLNKIQIRKGRQNVRSRNSNFLARSLKSLVVNKIKSGGKNEFGAAG